MLLGWKMVPITTYMPVYLLSGAQIEVAIYALVPAKLTRMRIKGLTV